jgi:hypothetical protein
MTETKFRQAFLSALKQRALNTRSSSKTVLPIGVVRTEELSRVIKAIERLPSDTQQHE